MIRLADERTEKERQDKERYGRRLSSVFSKELRDLSARCQHSLVPALPAMFTLEGEPFTLDNHFVFEPLFSRYLPKQRVFKCGRQVGKSQSAAAFIVSTSAMTPYFKTLVITPLSETVKRFSTLYVRTMIDGSPIRTDIVDPHSQKRVLQRSYLNGAINHFQYAFRDCDRIRGLTSHLNYYDEVQDMDPEHVPIINETMSASKYGGSLVLYTGTPKSLENTLSRIYEDSSQGEWCIPCPRCHYDNLVAKRFNLDAMTGPWREDISEAEPGLICARCKRPVDPRFGHWEHGRPELRESFPGYHVPQQIMPGHCFSADKWAELVGKREGLFNFSPARYYNEVCGEAYDSAGRLITEEDLKRACSLGFDNNLEEALKHKNNYHMRVLSVDWGGGGSKGTSWTVMTVLGWRGGDEIHVIYSHRSLTPHDRRGEAMMIVDLLKRFNCHHFVHDFNGAGAGREDAIVGAGFPFERVIPIAYVRAGVQSMMKYQPESELMQRGHYRLDKSRSLVNTCELIKSCSIKFFNYDFRGAEFRGLIQDFLALVEDKVDSRLGRDIYTVIRDQSLSDDFAHTVNMGACAIYHAVDHWPNVYVAGRYLYSEDLAL